MNIELKPFQEKAIEELVNSIKILLDKEGRRKVCVFQAPTGSGKTIMTAKVIEEIIKEFPEIDLCFVWVTIGKGDLYLQSKHTLEKLYAGVPKVSLVEEEFIGSRDKIDRNEIVVVNWEKLRTKERLTKEWKNILMKDGENINFRDVLYKTREQRKIILIIDESHIGSTAERTNELREEINADVIFEMSATPKINPDPKDMARNMARFIFVEPQDVIDDGIIKRELIINESIDKISESETDSQEVILEAGYQKRQQLKALFEKENSSVNPLVLIQIPTAEAGKDKIEAVKKFLLRKNITEKNGKLAIWLAEQKSDTLDWVSENDNEIEFLIFKQAIDTGWDCPRAHILLKFRETHSEIFEIQTVGRILRMPELRHYLNEKLNKGYIYTNVQSIIVKKEEYNPNIIKHKKSIRNDIYKDIQIPSYYKSRVDYGDITSGFSQVFENIACLEFNIKERFFFEQNIKLIQKKGIKIDIKSYQQEIIKDAKIQVESFDDIEYKKINAEETAKLKIAGNDLQTLFEQIIKNNLGSFRNIKRSVSPVKTAIYLWFQRYIGSKNWGEEFLMIQKIFVHNGNRKTFERILTKAIEEYRIVKEREIEKRDKENEQYYEFEIPKEQYFNQYTDEEFNARKCLYNPCYLRVDRSKPEKEFEIFIENQENKNLLWWWKNGENKKDYLGIRYEYPRGVISTFYPDYIIQFSDGTVGIFEIKDKNDQEGNGRTKAKAENLYTYIKQYPTKQRKLIGGIVIQVKGNWKINQDEKYNWDKCLKNDWSEWNDF